MKAISAILITGPTASGKSALALALAHRFDGVLINADSMQVYRDLRIITARPTPDDEASAPHVLYGHVDAALNHSVGLWLQDAAEALEQVRRSGRLPIFIGGTGLYFKALTQGLSAIPLVPDAVRARVRASAETLTPADLHARLAAVDPATAERLRPSDPQRLLRALEVFEATGASLSSFQTERGPALLDPEACVAFFLAPDRAALCNRIDARFDTMLDTGALSEAEALADRHLDPALPVMRAHGIPHLIRYIRGEMSLTEAADLGKRDTRQYTRRQFTFARHQLPMFEWATPATAEGAVLQALARRQASSGM